MRIDIDSKEVTIGKQMNTSTSHITHFLNIYLFLLCVYDCFAWMELDIFWGAPTSSQTKTERLIINFECSPFARACPTSSFNLI